MVLGNGIFNLTTLDDTPLFIYGFFVPLQWVRNFYLFWSVSFEKWRIKRKKNPIIPKLNHYQIPWKAFLYWARFKIQKPGGPIQFKSSMFITCYYLEGEAVACQTEDYLSSNKQKRLTFRLSNNTLCHSAFTVTVTFPVKMILPM